MISEKSKKDLIEWALNELACEQIIPEYNMLNTANVSKYLLAKDTILGLIERVENECKKRVKEQSL